MNFDTYREVTDTIINAIEAWVSKGQMPWTVATSSKIPSNASSRRDYNGINVLMLWVTAMNSGYSSSTWATYKQWKALGAQVNAGEKGSLIIFYKTLEVGDDDKGPSHDKNALTTNELFSLQSQAGCSMRL